jgi:hypothetical protein
VPTVTANARREVVGPLPTFLIIGAMKAGTTSLYHYMRSHPQVFMPAFKAPEFFATEPRPRRGIDWYRKQFSGAGPDSVAIGEASNVYTKFPTYTGVPRRIAEHIPDVRLVYIVRDPIERIRSHYQTRAAEGSEKSPFDTAVFENPIYLDYSRYARQIEQYMEHFPREQLLVVTSDDLRHHRRSVMQRVYEFIGVDIAFVPSDLDREFYRTQEKPLRSPVPLSIRKGLKKHFPASKRLKELESNVVRKLRSARGKNGSDSGLAAPFVMLDETRARLEEVLADDIRSLRGFLGPDFDGWNIA